ncbi:MAG: pectate lyase, partial [Gemmatimonadetes bacterium]|nr:pectate lyase [Gemmatimonadota bacterium]
MIRLCPGLRAGAATAALALAGCAVAAQQPPVGADQLLSETRIAALPAAEHAAWKAYLERSRAFRELDRRALAAEAAAAGVERLTPAAVHDGFYLDELTPAPTPEWLAGPDAAAPADAIVAFQTPSGGWSKRLSIARARRPGEQWTSTGNQGWLGTIDNGGTTEQLRFLAGIIARRPEPRWQRAFAAGIDYLLAAQFPNGCWPQVFPLVGSYHDAATFNDDAIVHVIRVLRQAGRGEPAFLAPALRARAATSAARGIDC